MFIRMVLAVTGAGKSGPKGSPDRKPLAELLLEPV